MGKSIAQLLLSVNAVLLRPDEPFTFASGIKSPIYCDNRLLLSDPKARSAVVEAFLEQLAPLEFDALAGMATAGIAWAAILADHLKKPMVYVRSTPKGYGKQNLIEGKLEKGARLVMIEDLVSTGGSARGAVQALREAGAIVEHGIVIVTYELPSASLECELHTLTNLSELLEVSDLTQKQRAIVRKWQRDPEQWP